jgi:hypothetical protein
MRSNIRVLIVLMVLFAFCGTVMATDSEQEIVNRFLAKTEVKHINKLSWFSANFSFNRINRYNEYNSFTNNLNTQLSGGRFSWLDNAKGVGLEFGTFVKKSVAWFAGGEYWLKFGETLNGDVVYNPIGGATTSLTNPSSEIKVIGFYTGVSYYVKNAPKANKLSTGLSIYTGGTVGYYQANWDIFPQYQNLNLSTAAPDAANTTFKGSAPGFSAHVGVEYPVKLAGLMINGEASYLFLNFKNMAWYNSVDQEVVATYGNSPDTRVDLTLSGLRGKVSVKKYFSW